MNNELDHNRIVTPSLKEDDNEVEGSLRPKSLREYIGQDKVKGKMKIFIDAAKMRGRKKYHRRCN